MIKAAAAGIRIVSEFDAGKEAEFMYYVNELLHGAEVIGFIGFGYHPVVMERFKIRELVHETPSRSFYGSAFELPSGRQKELRKTMRIELGADHIRAFQVLQQSELFYQGE
jgi:hypothetical protein